MWTEMNNIEELKAELKKIYVLLSTWRFRVIDR